MLQKKSYRKAGTIIATMGGLVSLGGIVSFQYASADSVISEKADLAFLLVAGGAILVTAGLFVAVWLLVSDY